MESVCTVVILHAMFLMRTLWELPMPMLLPTTVMSVPPASGPLLGMAGGLDKVGDCSERERGRGKVWITLG